MNSRTYLLLLLALSAGAAGGYFARGAGNSAATPVGNPSSAQAGGAGDSAAGSNASSRDQHDRTASASSGSASFMFAPGQAQAWLEGMAHFEVSDEGAAARLGQQCGRMDAATAEELATECFRISHLLENDDPVVSAKFPDSNLPDIILFQTMVRLAELNPTKAMALMHHSEDDSISDSMLSAVYSTVAQKDPELARQTVDGLAEEDRDAATSGVVMQLAKKDFQAAMKMLDAMPESEELRSKCIVQLAATEPESALGMAVERTKLMNFDGLNSLIQLDDDMRKRVADWVVNVSGPDANRIKMETLSHLADADDEAATALYDRISGSLDEDSQIACVESIASHMVRSNDEDVRDWLDKLPQGSVRDQALNTIIENKIGNLGMGNSPDGFYDSSGLSMWLDQLPPSEEKNQLVEQIIDSLATDKPDEALFWIATLPEGPDRDRAQKAAELRKELQALTKESSGDSEEDSPAEGALLGAGAGAIIGNQSGHLSGGIYGGATPPQPRRRH